MADGHHKRTRLHDVIASMSSSAINQMIMYPLDPIKTRLQTQALLKIPLYSGAFDCGIKVIKSEGISALYRGLSAVLFIQPAATAIVYSTYGAMQQQIVNRKYKQSQDVKVSEISTFEYGICGLACGVVASIISTPLELVKIKLQMQSKNLQSSVASKQVTYSGPYDCLKKLYRINGFRGLFLGFNVSLLRDIPANIVWFSTYETCRRRIGGPDAPFYINSLAGSCAGVAYWLVAFPSDLIKSRIQYSGCGTAKRFFKDTYETSKFKGFYAGFSATYAIFVLSNPS